MNGKEPLEQKVEILFQQIKDIRDTAKKAHTLANYAAQGHVEVRAEVKSIQKIQKNILNTQRLIDEKIEKINEKVAANLKWMIGIIVTMLLGFAGVIFTMVKVFTELMQIMK